MIERLKNLALARCQERIEESMERSKGRRKKPAPSVPSPGVTSLLRHHHGL
ncbi:hypothetical protein ASZ90_010344 [hydrocarbon metagenome]|uniref:Uncharacterized protein n=1 Tax=hydrocarbon metagenome TaxID=938273 RepID=A0A0W8FG94_9ZZZZ